MWRKTLFLLVLAVLSGCSGEGAEFSGGDSFGRDATEEISFDGGDGSHGEIDAATNPGRRLYVPTHSPAERQAELWAESRPEDAQIMARLAQVPVAVWLGEWSGDVRRTVEQHMDEAGRQEDAVPVFVLYYVPDRDCSGHSAGGARNAAEYRAWVEEIARGLDGREVIAILEPDAIPLSEMCQTEEEQRDLLALLAESVETLAEAGAEVYVDIGHSAWLSPERAIGLLREVGVENLAGFSLNVSNFRALKECTVYGEKVSENLGGIGFVVDTSRNGNGPDPEGEWCNPPDRALGVPPTPDTGHNLADWFLWVKIPGESDGECNGGPQAGSWWPEYALDLARNAGW